MSSTSPPRIFYPNTIGPSQNISIKKSTVLKRTINMYVCECIHIVIHIKILAALLSFHGVVVVTDDAGAGLGQSWARG